MLKKFALTGAIMTLSMLAMPTFAIAPGAGQVKMQNNMQQMQQNKIQIQQQRQIQEERKQKQKQVEIKYR